MKDKYIENKIKIVEAVPYQLCPKCNGLGITTQTLSNAVFSTCDVCLGNKIIPMYIIPKEA